MADSGALAALALTELHARDEELGVDPHAPSRVVTVDPVAPPPPQTFEIEPPDWDQELRQRRAAERAAAEQERTRIVQAELAELTGGEPPEPRPLRRGWKRRQETRP